MLTVDYDRLGLEPGDLLLDIGCGFGRHAFEGLRRGASVVACDFSAAELKEVHAVYVEMRDARAIPDGVTCAIANADTTRLPFADASFDRVIASEMLEHVSDDTTGLAELHRVLKPGGRLAVTVPAHLPERICWALSEEYHAPFVPGGHVRIYTQPELRMKMRAAGLVPGQSHRVHALHSPYWWLKCAVGPTNDDHPLVRAYHRLLVWDITKAPTVTRLTERALNPVFGKSLVVYATKPRLAAA